MARIFQVKRGLQANLPVLAQGELAMTTDNGAESLWLGTGSRNKKILLDPTAAAVGAAPAGYGLGNIDWHAAPDNDADQIVGTGWFLAKTNTPGPVWWLIRNESDGEHNDDALQTAFCVNDPAYQGCIAQRYKEAGVYDAWEWNNPPLQPGVEYRTTERYMGKPVYTRLMPFNNLTDRQYAYAAGRDGCVIRAFGEIQDSVVAGEWLPISTNYSGQTITFPTIAFTEYYNQSVGVFVPGGTGYIGKNARVQVWYYKKSDNGGAAL